MNWYSKFKQAKSLPESTEPYPEFQNTGLKYIDQLLKEKEIRKIFKKPVEFLGAGYWGGAWGYQGKVKKITRDPREFNTALDIIEKRKQGQILSFVVPVYSAKPINKTLYEIVIGKAQLLDNEELSMFDDMFYDTPKEWKNVDPAKIENMKKLVREFKKLFWESGAVNEDIGHRNVGKLNGKIVVLDIGAIRFTNRSK